MRLSVNKNDPGYSPKAFGARVFVDGTEITNCFTADEESGEAFVYIVDDHGRHVFSPLHTDIETTVIRGKVDIRFDDSR